MNRAPILDSLEDAFVRLGYTIQSEPNAKRLLMTHSDGSTMHADASDRSTYGYLTVTGKKDILLLIRLGQSGPYVLPHQCGGEGRELLKQLVEICEPFQQDWLKEYLENVA